MDEESMVSDDGSDGAEEPSASDRYDLESPGLTMEELVAVLI